MRVWVLFLFMKINANLHYSNPLDKRKKCLFFFIGDNPDREDTNKLFGKAAQPQENTNRTFFFFFLNTDIALCCFNIFKFVCPWLLQGKVLCKNNPKTMAPLQPRVWMNIHPYWITRPIWSIITHLVLFRRNISFIRGCVKFTSPFLDMLVTRSLWSKMCKSIFYSSNEICASSRLLQREKKLD